ncbi:ATP-dependent DNA helicase [Alkaliphilus peptidifermentans]|uniref:ATP-dependent DNA helicase DinG n=1 Tax=Alkaliphilus peptidifermentans DSM 18978 TaxID=1120976 RepID=A0A1G5LD78_9FIRM|nr:ATP-dependent DNA helicase [Alkaliphilus peptidifermentans]SCZ10268.1 ATP-dependent DNA helicase DinG [Alkaliphilus peptidifermentans DSM 18978]
MNKRIKGPFDYNRKEEFSGKLSQWIGEVFYDILPEHGYEVREEQIYTAFQLADAVCNKRVHFAEAGLGTGKTFAYLLTAIAYAGFTGKPVVIACASTALQEQLAGPKGDIQKLSNILGLEIDARMAKDPRQYICDSRVNDISSMYEENDKLMPNELNQWLEKTKLGERSEMPLISDRVWKQIGWDESMDCDLCSRSGYCKLVRAREHYRPARDLIIADHGIFFQDLWTREERIAEGKLPIIPDYSAVVFDEGHKVMLPAAMSAGQHINKEDIDNIIFSIEQIQEARESFISISIVLDKASSMFFETLNICVIKGKQSGRLAFNIEEKLLKAAENFREALDRLLLELQIEQELYIEAIPASIIKTYEIQIERATIALSRFYRNKGRDVITWIDQLDGSFWVVPRNLSEMLDAHLLHKGLPVVFSSATLSNEGDFGYLTRTLGLKKPSYSTVGSSFDNENQVVVYLSQFSSNNNEDDFSLSIKKLVSLLKLNDGRALVLTNSLNEVGKIRKGLEDYQLPFEILYEDRGERGYLVEKFREEVSSVLIGSNFWEGIDVPGEALSLLIVWQLPFPSLDPLIEVQRKEAKAEGLNPVLAVDYPEMGLKLKQGCGRLIRTKDDRGIIVIMDSVMGAPWEKIVKGALPSGAEVKTIEDLLNNTR